ncbi:hypothetical protein NSK_006666 [Nannochloropsis salina CCMP1776]|uniref:NADH dehydrogenase [ubiquinone] iron-sulfur protein 4, mitochondrial n=1 Tax=Nannochloropsis salina CCMP1776 TaxID=1027361 RepID=A0A4D9D049_9STRA|nr:hypothetical protein NSK_006666 [Nannochloropsis salina CCMP1776]|eukprot:TFJ81998.1 hypothetical protein NSK_006666 [Nannochloropsis salina CCMP1776]
MQSALRACGRLGTSRLQVTAPATHHLWYRCLSAPPQKPPPPPSPEELEKMVSASESHVEEIRAGTMKKVQPFLVADVPDLPTYLPQKEEEMAVLNEQPANQRARKVTIRQKAQTAMQSAANKSYPWYISWGSQERWSNPLMGWTSTADPLSNQQLAFDTAEEAARFAKRQGWAVSIEPPISREQVLGTKKYAFNFLAEDVENKLKREGTKTKQFTNPGYTASNWFQPLKYHGDGECEQHGPPREGAKKK